MVDLNKKEAEEIDVRMNRIRRLGDAMNMIQNETEQIVKSTAAATTSTTTNNQFAEQQH